MQKRLVWIVIVAIVVVAAILIVRLRPESDPAGDRTLRWSGTNSRVPVVDLAQLLHRTLHHLPARASRALDNAPATKFLAVFELSVAFQKHDGHRPCTHSSGCKGTPSRPQRLFPVHPFKLCGLRHDYTSKNQFCLPIEKFGLAGFEQMGPALSGEEFFRTAGAYY